MLWPKHCLVGFLQDLEDLMAILTLLRILHTALHSSKSWRKLLNSVYYFTVFICRQLLPYFCHCSGLSRGCEPGLREFLTLDGFSVIISCLNSRIQKVTIKSLFMLSDFYSAEQNIELQGTHKQHKTKDFRMQWSHEGVSVNHMLGNVWYLPPRPPPPPQHLGNMQKSMGTPL